MLANHARTSRYIDIAATAAFAIVVLGGFFIVNTASKEYRIAGGGLPPVMTVAPMVPSIVTEAEALPVQ